MELRQNGSLTSVYGKTLIGRNIIGDTESPSKSGQTFESRNPANLDDCVGVFPESGVEDLRAAALTARTAFASWSKTPAPVRGEAIGRWGALMERHKESLARLITREIGKTKREALGSVQEGIDTAHFFQSEGRRLYGQTVPSEMRNKELFTYRRPLGVCGMITAGNFPFAVPCWKIIPAVLAGNTVVWKPSEDSPAISYLLARLALDAGIPPGVISMITGKGGTTGKALVSLVDEGLIQKISFTGSSAVGRSIGEICGRNLQVPSLELGGKNPMIVMESANLEAAAKAAVWAAYGTAGQRCTSLANLILHRPIAKQFKERFMEEANTILIGDPSLHPEVTYGPMINERFLNTYLAHLEWGGKEGATRRFGDGRITPSKAPAGFSGNAERGLYVTPTLWDSVTISMRLAQEEIFGPTVNFIEAKDFDEAIAVANGTQYGLSSAIYTENPREIVRFKNEITAGMSSVNNSTTGAEAHLPFGGNGASGNGTRESGIWVIDAYTRWQAVNVDSSGQLQRAQMDTEYLAEGRAKTDLSALFPQ